MESSPAMIFIRNNIKKHIFTYWIALFAAFAVPLLIVMVIPRPESETLMSWVQRSGGIMLIIAIYAEFPVLGLNQAITNSALTPDKREKLQKEYGTHPLLMTMGTFIPASIGTYISSYGDLGFIREWSILVQLDLWPFGG